MELFIGGSQRSGTTLMQIALCRAFGCTTVLPEAQYLRTLLESYRHAIRRFEYETVAYFQTPPELQATRRS